MPALLACPMVAATRHCTSGRFADRLLAYFIAAVSNIYPLSTKKSDSEEHEPLSSFQQVKEHFEGVELSEALEMLFISLRLLHVTVIDLIKPK